MHSLKLELPHSFVHDYIEDQLFGPIYKSLNGEIPKDETQKNRIESLLSIFQLDGELFLYDGKICVQCLSVKKYCI